MPVILSGPSTSRPSITTVPRDGRRKPVASFMKVDLPQPDGPTMAMNSPLLDLQRDVLDGEAAGAQQLVVVGEPDVIEVDERHGRVTSSST